MSPKRLSSFEALLSDLESTYGLTYLGENDDEASNILYAFSDKLNSHKKSHILKQLGKNSVERRMYTLVLPKLSHPFETLELPKLIQIYELPEFDYLLMPYYQGDRFNFNTNDTELAKGMVGVIKDLSKINVEDVIPGGSTFDYEQTEKEFWNFFERAVELELIKPQDVNEVRDKSEKILLHGRKNQKLILSNGDFNPRNLIRVSTRKYVLIDWDGITAPLEHHLTYPWLLNFVNPNWQKKYASLFESELPLDLANIQYHLMKMSLIRAVGEMGHYKPGLNENPLIMVKDHMNNFYKSLEGFSSLSDI